VIVVAPAVVCHVVQILDRVVALVLATLSVRVLISHCSSSLFNIEKETRRDLPLTAKIERGYLLSLFMQIRVQLLSL
jgi:hypothetical protein